MTMMSSLWACVPLWLFLLQRTTANPSSKPYIPFRTSPFDQEGTLDHEIDWDEETLTSHRSRIHSHDAVPIDRCPLQFSLGISKRLHSGADPGHAIRQPPVIHPVYPARGPGRQVIYTTQYEHLDLLSPAPLETPGKAIKEALLQASDFPLLLESSSFHSSPILHDVNGDGIMDAILADYDGGIYVVGLAGNPRYFHKTQVPRLYIRRHWVESRVNETLKRNQPPPPPDEKKENETKADNVPDDPYHSYFEYFYSGDRHGEDVLRGVTANLLGQDHEQAQALKARRSRRVNHTRQQGEEEVDMEGELVEKESDKQEKDQQDEKQQRSERQRHQKSERERAQKGERQRQQRSERGRQQRSERKRAQKGAEEEEEEEEEEHRRLQEVDSQNEKDSTEEAGETNRAQEERKEERADKAGDASKDEDGSTGEKLQDVSKERDLPDVDDPEAPILDDVYVDDPDPFEAREGREKDSSDAGGDEDDFAMDDPDYGRNRFYDDEYGRYGDFDDMYGGYNAAHEEYYDSKHYIRIPPHILCTPTLAEVPKLYGNQNEMDDMLFVAVSYYLDEDEYQGFFSYKRFDEADQGDETEVKRGSYVASALMAYLLGDSTRWSGQTHLDLSTDFSAPENVTIVGAIPIQTDVSQMGAFALGSPTVADLDGDGTLEVLLGTSMGIVYAFDARQMYKKDKWPVQMKKPIESRVLVEDVVGNTNLEVFVADIGGTIACFGHDAQRIWNRNLVNSLAIDAKITGSSPMTLGDVDDDGTMDLVVVVRLDDRPFLFALNAATGEDLANFPIELEKYPSESTDSDELHEKLTQPLLVDLHSDQSFLDDYLRRNGTKWAKRTNSGSSKPPHGGSATGLHIVQPLGEQLYVIEAGSGCSQKVSIGDKVTSMVQVDDVHGTDRLDLVVSTESGNIVTLESASPFHPLNTWNHGELRGRMNAYAHGYSASQGIFVHEVSRQFVDIFGVYVPITFEIFDNRPGVSQEPDRRKYNVEIRDGPSYKRVLFRNDYAAPGVYTERVYVRFGPGYYSLHVIMRTSHGLVFEDSFQIGYNVNFLDGFGVLLWLPLCIAGAAILFCGVKKSNWEDEEDDAREGHGGILGRALPT